MARNDHSGYPMKWFKDENAARHAYECVICLEVVKDAVQVRDCGHQFCALCIDEILRADPRCPSCRIEISDAMVFADHAARRLIKQLEVNCCNEGCTWQGCLSSLLQGHQNNCNFLIQREDNDAHKLKVEELEQKHDTLMLRVLLFEQKHEQDITALKFKHEEDIKELKLKHEKDIRELKLKHEQEKQDIRELQLKHQKEKQDIRELQLKLEQEKKQITELYLKHEEEKQNIRELHDQLKHHQVFKEDIKGVQLKPVVVENVKSVERVLMQSDKPSEEDLSWEDKRGRIFDVIKLENEITEPPKKKTNKQRFKDMTKMDAYTDNSPPQEPVVEENVKAVEIVPVQSEKPSVEYLSWEDKGEKIGDEITVQKENDAGTEAPAAEQTRRKYERDFLLQFQFLPVCMEKPAGLPEIEVVLDAPVQPGKGGGSLRGSDFLPSYARQKSQGGGGRRDRRGKPPPRKITTATPAAPVVLKQSGNRWQRPGEREKKLSEGERKSAEFYRNVVAILNKLTPEKFKSLVEQVMALNIDTLERLEGVIDRIFEAAIREPLFSAVHGQLCQCLFTIKVVDAEGKYVSFRELLLNRCQKEFEKEKEDEQTLLEKNMQLEGLSEKERIMADKALATYKRRMFGVIRFIGELFKLKLLTENIMHDCIFKLLRAGDEESLESMCKLLFTIGKDLDSDKAKPRIEQYFDQINKIIINKKVSSRVVFMLRDVVDLRENQWIPRREENYNPKTIDQIHKEAQLEKMQEQRLAAQLPSKDNKKKLKKGRADTLTTVLEALKKKSLADIDVTKNDKTERKLVARADSPPLPQELKSAPTVIQNLGSTPQGKPHNIRPGRNPQQNSRFGHIQNDSQLRNQQGYPIQHDVLVQGQRQGYIPGHPMQMAPRPMRGRPMYSSSPQAHSPMQGFIPQQNLQYQVVGQDAYGQPVMRPAYIPNVQPAYQMQTTSAPFQPQFIQQQQQYFKPKRTGKIVIRDPRHNHKDVTDEILSNSTTANESWTSSEDD